MIFDKEDYKAYDADLWNAIAKEEERQQNNIELIASENVVSKAVMAAQGSILTNKYAEGYPGRRYYGGTDVVDVVENLAIERAKEIFGAKFANVQPHSGSFHDFKAPALAFRVFLVHLQEVTSKQLGFVSSCCSTDFQDNVLVIVWIFWKK